MRKIIVFLCLICLFAFSRCQRAPVPGFGFGLPIKIVSAKEEAFYHAVLFGTVEEIESFLRDGHDPDYMNAYRAIKWIDNNPLWTVCKDYEFAELFIKYGADVKERPYIWNVVATTPILSNKYPNEKLLENVRTRPEDEVYEIAKLFLDAGSDLNLKGLSGLAPFSLNMDKSYKKYFEKYGELSIVAPIEYSAFDVVNLLLEYGAILDENCLEAAKKATELIGNDEMEKYIYALWEEQQVRMNSIQ